MPSPVPLTLPQLNAASREEFSSLLAGTYEHSPWIAEAAWAQRPFASLAALKLALVGVVWDLREPPTELLRAGGISRPESSPS